MSRVRGAALASVVSILLGASATAGAGTVSVQPFCRAVDKSLMVLTIIESSYLENPAERYRQLWKISCSLETRECNAAALSVVGLEKGESITLHDFTVRQV
jgi:hypothetical protein